MPQLGVDYANTDQISTPGVIGFTRAKQAGARIIIPRAVYGRPAYGQTPCYIDSYWARDKNDITAAGLIRSSYLFVCVPKNGKDGKPLYTPTPEVQAGAFIKQVELRAAACGVKPTDMVPFFDVEEHSDLISSDEYFDWILRAARFMRAHYGAWPGMYTSDRVWTEELRNHASGQLQSCPLWLAKPWPIDVRQPVVLSGFPNLNPKPISEFGDATNWAIYQYQGDGLGMPGFSPGAVDMNRVNLIKRGMKGTIVKWIQERAGELVVDGDFGPATETRIKALQAGHQLMADGLVGMDTIALLSWMNPAP